MAVLTVLVCLAGGILWSYIALSQTDASTIEVVVMALLVAACFMLGLDYLTQRLAQRNRR